MTVLGMSGAVSQVQHYIVLWRLCYHGLFLAEICYAVVLGAAVSPEECNLSYRFPYVDDQHCCSIIMACRGHFFFQSHACRNTRSRSLHVQCSVFEHGGDNQARRRSWSHRPSTSLLGSRMDYLRCLESCVCCQQRRLDILKGRDKHAKYFLFPYPKDGTYMLSLTLLI